MRKPIKPEHCPLCGSQDIKTSYDNHGNGSYSEWYNFDCWTCGAGGQIEAKYLDELVPQPIVNDLVYVATSLYLSRGVDDFRGGVAQIIEVKDDGKHTINSIMIRIAERPGSWYNWKNLYRSQEENKKRYGDQKARPDPDYRKEMNEWE